SHRPRWRSHQRGARRCRPQLQPAPTLVRGAFTRPLVDPLPRPLGRPASPNRCRKTFFTADSVRGSTPRPVELLATIEIDLSYQPDRCPLGRSPLLSRPPPPP